MKSIHKLTADAITYMVIDNVLNWLLKRGFDTEDVLITSLDYAASHYWMSKLTAYDRDTLNALYAEHDEQTRYLAMAELIISPTDSRTKWLL